MLLGVRAEDLELVSAAEGFAFSVEVPEPLGSHVLLTDEVDGQSLRVAMPPDRVVRAGEVLTLRLNVDRIACIVPQTDLALEGE